MLDDLKEGKSVFQQKAEIMYIPFLKGFFCFFYIIVFRVCRAEIRTGTLRQAGSLTDELRHTRD
jgi:hypothetical protein